MMHQLNATFAPQGLRTLAILSSPYGRNFDLSGQTDTTPVSQADVTWFQHTFKVTYPILIDPNFSTVNRYLGAGYPTFYTIDRNGVIRYTNHGNGEVPYQELVAAITAAMKAHA